MSVIIRQLAEHRGTRRLLRSITPDMLVLWDGGLHSAETIVAVHERGAHGLLYARLLADIRHHQLPPRADRQNPRVLRFRRRKYPPKRPEHTPWPQPTMPFRQAIHLLN